jgi:hypothetical protein
MVPAGNAVAEQRGGTGEADDPSGGAGRSESEPKNFGGSAGADVTSSGGRATGGAPAGGSGENHSGGLHTGGSVGGGVTAPGGAPGGSTGSGKPSGGASGATHTGGTTNMGGAATTGGTTSVGGSGDGPFTVKAGGYVTSGAMKGYAWTGGDDVTPEDFSDLAAGGDLCASGTVPATEDYSGTGMIGINLNQATTGASKGSPYTPTGSGIKVTITNAGGSDLRLQVQGSKDYCTDITAPGGSFDWSEFTVDCWEAGGAAYDGSATITAIMVLVPGEGPDGSDVDYEFCITNVEEVP